MPESVVYVKQKAGWVAHIRYADCNLDKDIASVKRYLLDRKVDFLFRNVEAKW